MDSNDYAPEPPRPHEPPPARAANDLPEARDKTTERIHNMADFKVSEYLGLPLLTKDIGRKEPRTDAQPGRRRGGFADTYFGYFSSQDRPMLAAAAVINLGPLFLGALRG
jgi:hypothetical protein